MPIHLPIISDAESTPLVRQLLEIIRGQQERLQQLEDEIARLKGLKPRPVIAPSRLETPPTNPPRPDRKRPGSAKRPKTSQLIITEDLVIPLANVPDGATFKGYDDFVVQESPSGLGPHDTAANDGGPPGARISWPLCPSMSSPAAISGPS